MSAKTPPIILADLGSSTLKAYRKTGEMIEPLVQKSVHFKRNFDPGSGLTEENERELFGFLESLQEKNPEAKIKIFATSIFRQLKKEARTRLVDMIYTRTGLLLNIVDHDLENFYLEVALTGRYVLDEPVLLINIGGGSTELVVVYGKQAVERANIENLGVGNVLQQFPKLNDPVSKIPLKEITDFVTKALPELKNKVRVAFYSGGELNYMKLAHYPMSGNTLFDDLDHPLVISVDKFKTKNHEIFNKVKLTELEALMPNNPKWMHGARPCSAIAQAICEKYGVETIIPSDSNLAHGAARQEFRYVTISGSFRKHLKQIIAVKNQVEQTGAEVLSPKFLEPRNPGEEFVVFTGEEGQSPLELERHHLDCIQQSDALIVCDPAGYVGASALIEIGFAHDLGKRIIYVEQPEEFMLKTLPGEIGL